MTSQCDHYGWWLGRGEGGSTRVLLVSKVLPKKKGIKRLVKMDVATLCDGNRSIIINADFTKTLKKTKQKFRTKRTTGYKS